MEIPEGWGGYQRTSGIEEWKFQEGGGFKLKSQLLGGGGGGMDIFWNHTLHLKETKYIFIL